MKNNKENREKVTAFVRALNLSLLLTGVLLIFCKALGLLAEVSWFMVFSPFILFMFAPLIILTVLYVLVLVADFFRFVFSFKTASKE